MNLEERKLLEYSAAKVGTLTKQFDRLINLIDELVANFEISSPRYDILEVEITDSVFLITIEQPNNEAIKIGRALKEYVNIGALANSFIPDTFIRCYVKNKHKTISTSLLPKIKKTMRTPYVDIIIRL